VALRTNNNIVISASCEEILVWDASTAKILQSYNGCSAMAAHPTLDQVAVSTSDGHIVIMHATTMTKLSNVETGLKSIKITSMAWASDTHLLFAADNKIRLLDTTKSKVERTYDSHTGTVLHIECFSIDNNPTSSASKSNATHFFSLCNKDLVLCWQVSTGKIVSKTNARGNCSTLFVLDDRGSKSLTQKLLPILIDPEGVTVIAAKDDSIKIEDPDLTRGLAVLTASTPVLLL
jgi:hypothetical protein